MAHERGRMTATAEITIKPPIIKIRADSKGHVEIEGLDADSQALVLALDNDDRRRVIEGWEQLEPTMTQTLEEELAGRTKVMIDRLIDTGWLKLRGYLWRFEFARFRLKLWDGHGNKHA